MRSLLIFSIIFCLRRCEVWQEAFPMKASDVSRAGTSLSRSSSTLSESLSTACTISRLQRGVRRRPASVPGSVEVIYQLGVRVHFIQTRGDGNRAFSRIKQVSPCGIREGSEAHPNAPFGARGDFHHPSNVSILIEDGVEGIHFLRPGSSQNPLGCLE